MKNIKLVGYKKTVIGVILIVVACISMISWEVFGRETLLLDNVVVAKQDIMEGTRITKDMLGISKVLKENKINDVWLATDIEKIYGKKINREVLKNSQISEQYFQSKSAKLKKGQSIYALKGEWIDMRSSALRKGDIVDIIVGVLPTGGIEEGESQEGEQHENPGSTDLEKTGDQGGDVAEITKFLGTYEIAFVKDSTDREVVTVNKIGKETITDRKDSSSVIDHLEIICTLEEYEVIREQTSYYELPSLTIVHNLED